MTKTENAAYGFRWNGISGAGLTLRDAAGWDALSVTQTVSAAPARPGADVRADFASVQTPAAELRLDRRAASVEICSCEPVPAADVIHPSLWPAAAVFARWRGRETFHAGAVSVDGEGAWAFLGDRGAGKSSLLAALAMRDVEVLVDDLLVVEGQQCFAGPRCIDLRPEAAAALGVDGETTLVRCTERRRVSLPPCRGSYELRGFVHLAWEPRTRIDRLSPAESFRLLVDHRRVAALGAEFEHLLALAGLPALRLARPREWRAIDSTVTVLADSLWDSAHAEPSDTHGSSSPALTDRRLRPRSLASR